MNRRRQRERGSLMVALMAAIAIMMILATVATQAWVDVVRRDNEAEMIFRAEDLVRALKRYQTEKATTLPTELKQLMEPGSKGQYFLRHLWKDPLVKGGKWGLLYQVPGGGILDPEAAVPEDPNASKPPTPGLGTDTGVTSPEKIVFDKSLFDKEKKGEGDQFAGLPIAGVRSLCKQKPFRVYREKTEYKDWLFTIVDLDNPPAGTTTPTQ